MIRLALIFALITMVAGGINYWYYRDSQARLAGLYQKVATQQVAIDELNTTLTKLQNDADKVRRNTQTYFDNLTTLRGEVERQKGILERHNLDKLGVAHPALLERHINSGSQRILKQFEDLTHAKH